MLEKIFLVIAGLLFMSILIGKLFVFNKCRPNTAAALGALISGLFLAYSICNMLIAINLKGVIGAVFFLFAVSPFIIGKFTTYKNITLCTYVQLSIIAFNIAAAIWYIK